MSQRDDDGAMFFLRALDEVDARPAPMTKRANAALPPKPAREGLQAHDMTPMAKKAPKATTATGPTPLSPAQKPPVANIADKAKTAGDILRIARAATIPTKTFADISKLASVLLERSLRPAQPQRVKKANITSGPLPVNEQIMNALRSAGGAVQGMGQAALAARYPSQSGAPMGGLQSALAYLLNAGEGAQAAGAGRRGIGALAGMAGGALGEHALGGLGKAVSTAYPSPAASMLHGALAGVGSGAGSRLAGRMMRAPAAPPAPPPGALERLLASMKANPGMAAAGAGAAGLGAYGLHRLLSGGGQDR